MLLRGSGECVCVEDQSLVSEAHISESTTSNVSSITLLIRCVSLCRSLSLPTCFIHGLRPDVDEDFNLSSTASVTNCRRGTPCAAAFDFARRKIMSGISRVVFTEPIFPYLWDMSQKHSIAMTRPSSSPIAAASVWAAKRSTSAPSLPGGWHHSSRFMRLPVQRKSGSEPLHHGFRTAHDEVCFRPTHSSSAIPTHA